MKALAERYVFDQCQNDRKEGGQTDDGGSFVIECGSDGNGSTDDGFSIAAGHGVEDFEGFGQYEEKDKGDDDLYFGEEGISKGREFGAAASGKQRDLGAQDSGDECSKCEGKGDGDQRRIGHQQGHEIDSLKRERLKGHLERSKVHMGGSGKSEGFKGFGSKNIIVRQDAREGTRFPCCKQTVL